MNFTLPTQIRQNKKQTKVLLGGNLILSYLPIISESKIKVYTDSQSAAHIVEVGSMDSELHKLAISVFNTCLSSNIIILDVKWIPRTMNKQADFY